MIECPKLISKVRQILNNKHGMKYRSDDTELMRKMAAAHSQKSLRDFQKVLEENKELVEKDPIIDSHIKNLYENLLQQNLIKIVEPYSRVEISYIAELVNLPPAKVQSK